VAEVVVELPRALRRRFRDSPFPNRWLHSGRTDK
jgi:hypothetical protein